jgi:hypothetical protein
MGKDSVLTKNISTIRSSSNVGRVCKGENRINESL